MPAAPRPTPPLSTPPPAPRPIPHRLPPVDINEAKDMCSDALRMIHRRVNGERCDECGNGTAKAADIGAMRQLLGDLGFISQLAPQQGTGPKLDEPDIEATKYRDRP